jgi:small subunit ribosomal protein S16
MIIGTYDPIPKPAPYGQGKPYKDIKLDIARAKYWLGVGAQPSDPAWRLLSMVRSQFRVQCTHQMAILC